MEAIRLFAGPNLPKIFQLLNFVRTEYIGWPHPPMLPWYARGKRATVMTFSTYERLRFRSNQAMEAMNKKLNARVRMFSSGTSISAEAFLSGMKLMEKLARADVDRIDKKFDGLTYEEIENLKYQQMTKSTQKMLKIRRKYHPVSQLNMHVYLSEMIDVINS